MVEIKIDAKASPEVQRWTKKAINNEIKFTDIKVIKEGNLVMNDGTVLMPDSIGKSSLGGVLLCATVDRIR